MNWSEQTKRHVCQLAMKDYKNVEIANMTGVPHITVWRWTKEIREKDPFIAARNRLTHLIKKENKKKSDYQEITNLNKVLLSMMPVG